MKMTKKQRAEVVELLRCGADCVDEGLTPLTYACRYLDMSDSVLSSAVDARCAVSRALRTPRFLEGSEYRYELLEAAQRVEDKEWP